MKQGEFQEASLSEKYHTKNCAVLVSPLVLRSMDLGQIDLAYLSKNKRGVRLHLIEVKSSRYPSRGQQRRLLRTQDYLSKVLNIESILEVKFCQKDDQTLFF